MRMRRIRRRRIRRRRYHRRLRSRLRSQRYAPPRFVTLPPSAVAAEPGQLLSRVRVCVCACARTYIVRVYRSFEIVCNDS